MSTTEKYLIALGRLRKMRQAHGFTLRDVEIKSNGRWKAIVIGSYERGVRKLTLEKAVELCDFYGADISNLGTRAISDSKPTQPIFDLKRLRELEGDPIANILKQRLGWIISQREDWNGTVLSIRRSDLTELEISTAHNAQELNASLQHRKLLLRAPDRP